jgi:hypothetical protein
MTDGHFNNSRDSFVKFVSSIITLFAATTTKNNDTINDQPIALIPSLQPMATQLR